MAYVTKDEVKKYLGVDFTSGYDTYVDKVIAACQLYIEKKCGTENLGKRKFEAPDPDVSSVRKFNGNGGTKLFVGDLFDIESLTIDDIEYVRDEDFFLYPLNNEDEAFHWIELAQPFTRINNNSRLSDQDAYVFEAGQANVVIDGYWYFSETCPADISLAMMKLVGAVLKENIGDPDVREKKSESLGDYSVDFQEISKIAHTIGVDDLLKAYSMEVSLKKSGFSGSAGIVQVS